MNRNVTSWRWCRPFPCSANFFLCVVSFLADFRIRSFGMDSLGKVAYQNQEQVSWQIWNVKISFQHPLFRSVFEKKIDNFQYPNTKTSFAINSSNASILGYEDQSIFLTALQNHVSAVYVFSAPINKMNSNFQNSPLIVPTFYNMAKIARKREWLHWLLVTTSHFW